MKVVTTVAEMKEIASKDNRASFIFQLNKEICSFLKSIGGKNRDFVSTNLAQWRDCIRNGEWVTDNCEMKINSSCTWLIEGHHRNEAVIMENAYGLLGRIIVVPDDVQEKVFMNQDCRGARRNLGVQATLCGVSNAAFWLAIEKSYRCDLFASRTPSTVNSVKKFLEEKKSVIDKIDTRRKFNGESVAVPASSVACMIRAAEIYPNRTDDLNSFWNRIITGEMMTSRMPEYHLRNRLRAKECSKKEIVFLSLKAIGLGLDGIETGTLKIVDSDISKLSTRFKIASNRNKIGNCTTSSAIKKIISKNKRANH